LGAIESHTLIMVHANEFESYAMQRKKSEMSRDEQKRMRSVFKSRKEKKFPTFPPFVSINNWKEILVTLINLLGLSKQHVF
jgi:hypothetical protein